MGEEGGGVFVAEVAVATDDTAFGGWGTGGLHKEFDVVVEFEDQGVAVGEAVFDYGGGVTEVGADAEAVGAVVDDIADGVAGVVWEAEAGNFEIAKGEGGTGFEECPRGGCFALVA